ncbi:hypothetical protein GCM10009000_014110 [Halobacterium noricense]
MLAAHTTKIPEALAATISNEDDADTRTVTSPDGSVRVTFDVSSDVPTYAVSFDGTTYLTTSNLGFDFQNQPPFGATAAGDSGADITVTGSETGTATETWNPLWDQYATISQEYTYLRVGLVETSAPERAVNIEFRVFDDGLGFRFVLSDDFASNGGNVVVTSENTQFDFADDYTAWWIRNEFVNPRFEQEYDCFDAPDAAVSGRSISVTVTGTNHGSVIGGEDLSVFVDGEAIATAFVRLVPGQSESTVQFELPTLSEGNHEIRIGRSLDEALPARTIRILPSMSLSSTWLFRKGDDAAWANPDYDDGDWEQVELPANWEDHSGHTEDNVFGWYRKTITIPASWEEYGEDLLLPVGKIDDVDRTFFNGEEIGQNGSFPEDGFDTAWQLPREYSAPTETVNYGDENVIAVRVYDAGGGGGLYAGPIGPVQPDYNRS